MRKRIVRTSPYVLGDITVAPSLNAVPPPCTAVPCTAVPCKQATTGWTLVAIAAAGLVLNIFKFVKPSKWAV